jgi:hypothetical protein
MIVTIVRFEPAAPMTLDDARARFGANAPRYLEIPGLLWKAYLLSEDGTTVGGTYWWRDRASAEALFTDEWREGVTAKYGRPPTIEWFAAPVVADGRAGVIRVVAPPETTVPETTVPETTVPDGNETREG